MCLQVVITVKKLQKKNKERHYFYTKEVRLCTTVEGLFEELDLVKDLVKSSLKPTSTKASMGQDF
jgi:hypothetical protein